MATRLFSPLRGIGKERVVLAGSFQPNGASTTVSGVKGVGFTASHTAGSNTYTVTLNDAYFDYDAVNLQIQSPVLGQQVQLVSESVVSGSTRSIVIGLLDSGTKTATNDQPFNANIRIHFLAILKNTSLGANY